MQDRAFSLEEYYARTNELFLRGDPAGLEQHHLEALKRLEDAGADRTPVAASVYNEVGCWLRGMSRYKESLEFYLRSLDVIEECGDECADMATRVRLNLATLYRLMGDLDGAEALFKQVCEELAAGTDPYAYVSALNNLSLVYQDKGDLEKALELFDRIFALLPGCPNVDEHEVGTTYANAAGVCMRKGEYDEAENLSRNAIEIFEAMEREDSHLASAWTMHGMALFMEGKLAEAREAFEHALDLDFKYYGRNADYARISQSLARTLERLGDIAAASERQRAAVEVLSALYGVDDDRVMAAQAYCERLIERKARDEHERC